MKSISTIRRQTTAAVYTVLPGLLLTGIVSAAALLTAPIVSKFVPVPAIVIAILFGMALNPLAEKLAFQAGIAFCVKNVLRWAVALLGLRIALGEIAALGLQTAVIVIVSMIATIASGLVISRQLGKSNYFGVLAGTGTAICGASATLAAASVLPNYRGKESDVAFVVIAMNALSTLAMFLYPPLCIWLGFEDHVTGIFLGATIHDVAQVVGAGYAISESVGNTAVVVKLFRVFLLIPVVISIGYFLASQTSEGQQKSVPIPAFAFAFLGLCVINTFAPQAGEIAETYRAMKALLIEASAFGVLLALAALGLGTSFRAIQLLGARYLLTVGVTTTVILVIVAAGLFIST